MKNYPSITTTRLTLVPPKIQDVPTIVQYAGHADVAKTTANMPHPYHEEDAIFWLNMSYQGFKQGDKAVFSIRDKSTDAFMGGIGLHIDEAHNRAELGYWIAVPFWNQGFMTEALTALLKYGFETRELNRIYAVHMIENESSGRVMAKSGMKKEGIIPDAVHARGDYRTLVQYGLTREDYGG